MATNTVKHAVSGHPMSKKYRPLQPEQQPQQEPAQLTAYSSGHKTKQQRHKKPSSYISNNVVSDSSETKTPETSFGQRPLLSMALKQKHDWAKVPDIPQAEPTYFNVSLDRKFPVNLYWEERQNSDLRRWIQHRRIIEYTTKKAVDNSLPTVHLNKLSHDARVKQTRMSMAAKSLAAENKRIKARLNKINGNYNVKKWENDYQSHVKIANHISKIPRPPSINSDTVFQKISRPPTYPYPHLVPSQHTTTDETVSQAASVVKPEKQQNTVPAKQSNNPNQPSHPNKPKPKRKLPARTNGVTFAKSKAVVVNESSPASKKPSQSSSANDKSDNPDEPRDPREELFSDQKDLANDAEMDNNSESSRPTSPGFPRQQISTNKEGTRHSPVNEVYGFMKPFSSLHNTTDSTNPKHSMLSDDNNTGRQSHGGMKVRFPEEQVGPPSPSPDKDEAEADDSDDVPLPRQVYRRTPVPPHSPTGQEMDDEQQPESPRPEGNSPVENKVLPEKNNEDATANTAEMSKSPKLEEDAPAAADKTGNGDPADSEMNKAPSRGDNSAEPHHQHRQSVGKVDVDLNNEDNQNDKAEASQSKENESEADFARESPKPKDDDDPFDASTNEFPRKRTSSIAQNSVSSAVKIPTKARFREQTPFSATNQDEDRDATAHDAHGVIKSESESISNTGANTTMESEDIARAMKDLALTTKTESLQVDDSEADASTTDGNKRKKTAGGDDLYRRALLGEAAATSIPTSSSADFAPVSDSYFDPLSSTWKNLHGIDAGVHPAEQPSSEENQGQENQSQAPDGTADSDIEIEKLQSKDQHGIPTIDSTPNGHKEDEKDHSEESTAHREITNQPNVTLDIKEDQTIEQGKAKEKTDDGFY